MATAVLTLLAVKQWLGRPGNGGGTRAAP